MPAYFLALTLMAGGATGQTAGPSPDPAHMPPDEAPTPAIMVGGAARRFPQPVRVGDLIGRDLLQPKESQPVLGHVEDVVRQDDGRICVVVRQSGAFALDWLGWQGFGTRLVSVPIEAFAVLGEHLALIGLASSQLDAMPPYVPGSIGSASREETIRVGIVRPFH